MKFDRLDSTQLKYAKACVFQGDGGVRFVEERLSFGCCIKNFNSECLQTSFIFSNRKQSKSFSPNYALILLFCVQVSVFWWRLTLRSGAV